MKRRSSAWCAVLVVASLGLSVLGCQYTETVEDLLIEPSDWSSGKVATDAWVMPFIGTAKTKAADSLHLAYSMNGYQWTKITTTSGTDDDELFQSSIGTGHIRDPFLFRKNDGTFVILASDFTQSAGSLEPGSVMNFTSYWDKPSSSIYVLDSKNLLSFTGGRLVRLTQSLGPNGKQRRVTAPKAMYDKRNKCYAIYWTGTDESGVNRTYVSYTYDFREILNPESDDVFFDPGYSQSGASVFSQGDTQYLVFREDGINTGNDLRLARSSDFRAGSFEVTSSNFYLNRGLDQTTMIDVNSPFAVSLGGSSWLLYAKYTSTATTWGAWVTSDLTGSKEAWAPVDVSSYTFPAASTASAVRVTISELNAVRNYPW